MTRRKWPISAQWKPKETFASLRMLFANERMSQRVNVASSASQSHKSHRHRPPSGTFCFAWHDAGMCVSAVRQKAVASSCMSCQTSSLTGSWMRIFGLAVTTSQLRAAVAVREEQQVRQCEVG